MCVGIKPRELIGKIKFYKFNMRQIESYMISLFTILLFVSSACSKSRGEEMSSNPIVKDTAIVVDTSKTNKDTVKVTEPATKRYLALGDSYTIGESVLENERYPKQLQESLIKNGISITDLNIIAQTGWTTGDLLNALAAAAPNGNYDLVTLLIGVNNQYRGLSLTDYSAEFINLLDKCKEYAGNDKNKVVVISIPDYSVVPFAQYSDTVKIRTQLEAFNKVNRDITAQYGIKYVDVFTLSQEARYDKTLVAKDDLHFSGIEYAKWANLLVPVAKEILK